MSSSSINHNLSLYIPRVFANITKERIARVFESLNFGYVSRVDLVVKESPNGQHYNSAYIHFDEWFDTTANRAFQDRVIHPERDARVVYDDPWYWIVLENKGKKQVAGERKPRIEIQSKSNSKPQPKEGSASNRKVMPSCDFVDAEYAAQLEFQNSQLRMIVMQMQQRMRSPSFDDDELDCCAHGCEHEHADDELEQTEV
jgi:hypothetical protein